MSVSRVARRGRGSAQRMPPAWRPRTRMEFVGSEVPYCPALRHHDLDRHRPTLPERGARVGEYLVGEVRCGSGAIARCGGFPPASTVARARAPQANEASVVSRRCSIANPEAATFSRVSASVAKKARRGGPRPRRRVVRLAARPLHDLQQAEPGTGLEHPVDLAIERTLVGDVHGDVHREGRRRTPRRRTASPARRPARRRPRSASPSREARCRATSQNSAVRSIPLTRQPKRRAT